jgi:hypothetical protein
LRIDIGTCAQKRNAREYVAQLGLEQLQLHLVAPLLPCVRARSVHQGFAIGPLIRREPRAPAIEIEEEISVSREDWAERGRLARIGRRAAAVVEQNGGERSSAWRTP